TQPPPRPQPPRGPRPPAVRRSASVPPPPEPSTGRWQRVNLNPKMSKRWRAGLGVLGVIVVLAVCGIGSYLIVLDEQKGVQAQANGGPKPTVTPVDISSREVDSQPLTIAEVFPSDTIVIDPKNPDQVYTVVAKQELADCRTATKGEVTALISQLGCSQVIRATMRSPDGFLVTGGLLNLDTQASAEKAWESIRKMVDDQKGGFYGYSPTNDRTTKPLVLAQTVVGWNMKGHYLAYCVIARGDGEEIPNRDPFASRIMWDIIEIYLKGNILEARATDPVIDPSAPAPSASP
ncbi:hypothetical protein, partial [Allorhizocola rhizosphaerae]|uniref:hypothetical protein n=1 Tax=Allorhizocola rhizosphaerae TaxID=1872709 RepID=UPI0013C379DE